METAQPLWAAYTTVLVSPCVSPYIWHEPLVFQLKLYGSTDLQIFTVNPTAAWEGGTQSVFSLHRLNTPSSSSRWRGKKPRNGLSGCGLTLAPFS